MTTPTPKMLRETANRLEVDPETVEHDVLMARVSDAIDRLRAAADELEDLSDRVSPPWTETPNDERHAPRDHAHTRAFTRHSRNLDEHAERLDAHDLAILKNGDRITNSGLQFTNEIDELRQAINDLDDRLAAAHEHTSGVETRTILGEAKAAEHDERIVGNHNRIATIEQALANHPRYFTQLRHTGARLGERLDFVEQVIQTHHGRISDHEDRVTELQQSLGGMVTHSQLDAVARTVGALQEHTGHVSPDHTTEGRT